MAAKGECLSCGTALDAAAGAGRVPSAAGRWAVLRRVATAGGELPASADGQRRRLGR